MTIKERIKELEAHERLARAYFYNQADKKWLESWTHEKYCELLRLRALSCEIKA